MNSVIESAPPSFSKGTVQHNVHNIDKLAEIIERDRVPLLATWRNQVRELPAAKYLDIPTLNDHVPVLLDELARALRSHTEVTIPEALRAGSPPAHGLQRLEDGYDIEEVVAEYNILRACIHDVANSSGINLQGAPFHILNRVLDGAIGLAVQAYATRQALEVRHRREEYLAFVVHDLRTPLNAIALSARVLEMTLPTESGGGEVGRMLKALRRNVQRLDVLVRKIIEENVNLTAAPGVTLQRRTLDLWPLVESLVYDLQPLAKAASTQLINNVPDDLVVYADADVLKRIYENLIANAIKHTPHGKVSIDAREIGAEGQVESWISDDGVGIPEAQLEKIFDKGETDSPNDDGIGLGLAIVKTFTEAHGGKVSVESKEGAGSTFRFWLPGRTSVTA